MRTGDISAVKHRSGASRRSAGPIEVSTIGLGTYLGAPDDATDLAMKECLLTALRAGVNVIDTSPNYRAERSEAVVGQVLATAASEGIRREDVVVCSKVGFLPYNREYPTDTGEYYRVRFLESGIVRPEWMFATGQCFHPAYIDWQLEESLARLGSKWLDIYYLHNPEALCLHLSPAEVEQVLRAAFLRLLHYCQEGIIRFCGVSTWGAFINEDGPERLSLADVVRWAQETGLGDYFRFVQLPLSIGLPTGVFSRTQEYRGQRWSVVRLARQLNLAVFASAPFMNGRLLATPLGPEVIRVFPDAATDAQRCLEFARSAPGIAACLVGTTKPDHLQEILALADRQPMSAAAYAKAFS